MAPLATCGCVAPARQCFHAADYPRRHPDRPYAPFHVESCTGEPLMACHCASTGPKHRRSARQVPVSAVAAAHGWVRIQRDWVPSLDGGEPRRAPLRGVSLPTRVRRHAFSLPSKRAWPRSASALTRSVELRAPGLQRCADWRRAWGTRPQPPQKHYKACAVRSSGTYAHSPYGADTHRAQEPGARGYPRALPEGILARPRDAERRDAALPLAPDTRRHLARDKPIAELPPLSRSPAATPAASPNTALGSMH